MRKLIISIGITAFLGIGAVKAQHPSLGGGTGINTDPYLITDTTHLRTLADYVNAGNGDNTSGVYYKLMNNLDLSTYTNWKPIGYYNSSSDYSFFQGHFDGNEKVICNLTINRPGQSGVGLFGYVNNGSIKNLGVESGGIRGDGVTGGLVGGLNDNSSIINCYVTGKVSGGVYQRIGGLVGSTTNSVIENSYATSNVSGGYCIGGLVGCNSNTSIKNCYATGNVNGYQYIGGLVGANDNSTIKNCVVANDSVIATSTTKDINRIAGEDNSGTYISNYALKIMVVQGNGSDVSITNGSNLAGWATEKDTLQAFWFYNADFQWDGAAWDIANPNGVWKICDGEAMYPFLRWQRVSCIGESVVYTITATAGANGSITPAGAIDVEEGDDETFTFTANNGYEIDSLWIDGIYAPDSIAVGSYTFENVTTNHTISVSFKQKQVGIVGAYSIRPIEIYPNPTTGQITITGYPISDIRLSEVGNRISDIEIYDIIGKLQESRISEIGQSEIVLDISHLSNGLYFLKIDNKMVKIIKK